MSRKTIAKPRNTRWSLTTNSGIATTGIPASGLRAGFPLTILWVVLSARPGTQFDMNGSYATSVKWTFMTDDELANRRLSEIAPLK